MVSVLSPKGPNFFTDKDLPQVNMRHIHQCLHSISLQQCQLCRWSTD